MKILRLSLKGLQRLQILYPRFAVALCASWNGSINAQLDQLTSLYGSIMRELDVLILLQVSNVLTAAFNPLLYLSTTKCRARVTMTLKILLLTSARYLNSLL
jgi:hypothetical protein